LGSAALVLVFTIAWMSVPQPDVFQLQMFISLSDIVKCINNARKVCLRRSRIYVVRFPFSSTVISFALFTCNWLYFIPSPQEIVWTQLTACFGSSSFVFICILLQVFLQWPLFTYWNTVFLMSLCNKSVFSFNC
jgi:hypothetical protein